MSLGTYQYHGSMSVWQMLDARVDSMHSPVRIDEIHHLCWIQRRQPFPYLDWYNDQLLQPIWNCTVQGFFLLLETSSELLGLYVYLSFRRAPPQLTSVLSLNALICTKNLNVLGSLGTPFTIFGWILNPALNAQHPSESNNINLIISNWIFPFD